jgi:hypothetical protein
VKAFLQPRSAAIAFCALVSACSASSDPAVASPSTSFPGDPLLTVPTDSGNLRVAVRTAPTQPPPRGTISAELTVTDATGKPQDGLTVTVVPWMPAMGHGSSVVPVVTAEGGGKYLVTRLSLYMAGQWQLRTSFDGPASDHAAPSFQVP